MNRRSSIKYLTVFATLGVSSFSLFKFLSSRTVPDLKLLASKKALIAELADVIIPRTDTPGAKDAGVEDFIIRMLTFGNDTISQHTFINGLQDVELYCLDSYSTDFFLCNNQQKIAVLKHFEAKSNYSNEFLNKVKNKILGQSFFSKIKDLTVEGYCTSMIGATQGLAYDYIPSKYDNCVLLKNNQHSWATK